ncbi:neuropeptide Y receptor type 2-like isoform X2 [Montipora foliosa]|uniref:neuropeptide Y receptor type 2-like isoform X2 n=1 Tax=Montipora foliosa TaxID=591990 RepID=UPI0035F12064
MNNSLGNLSGETPTSQMDNFSEPLGLRIFRLTLYVVIFLLATVGNALVIFVVYKSRELHTVSGFLIANLAVADLGVGLLCIPFTVVYFELNFYWPFGPVMCKLLPALMPCFVMGSVGTMLAISVDRHQSIVHPFGMRITRFQGKLIILMIWLTALLPALPILGASSPNGERCEESWPTGFPYEKIYLLCSFALTYAIPLPIMIIIYIKIGLKLRQATKEGGDRPGFIQAQATKRIIKMLSVVVICYALCFLPFHTFYFMFDSGIDPSCSPISNC